MKEMMMIGIKNWKKPENIVYLQFIILQLAQILSAIWTNTFYNWVKYI